MNTINEQNTNVKEFELNKEDLVNVYSRLKIIDYFTNLIVADTYVYIREVILPRIGIPKSWAIMHSPDWKKITIIGPTETTYGNAITREEIETGKISQGVESKKQSKSTSNSG